MNKLLFILFVLVSFSAKAQQVVSSAANETNGISWTIGEVMTETIVVDNVIVAQGFNQPGEYDPNVGIKTEKSELESTVFPNPVKDIVTISCEEAPEFTWQISNLPGQRVAIGKSVTGTASIDMSNYPAGNYIVTVTSQQKTKSSILIKK